MRAKGFGAWAFVVAGGLLLSGDLGAGSLEPPGPPAPTMKTLQEVESRIPITSLPTTISTPGSYYLTGNLTGISGSHGITIASSFVTLDLNGFSLVGVAGSAAGIVAADVKMIVIRNGTIRGWGNLGISATGGIQVENVGVDSNGGAGMNVGSLSIVRNVTATGNAIGIIAGSGSTIDGCTAAGNAGTGIEVTQGVVSRSTALSNGGDGIMLNEASVATDCTAVGNFNGFGLGNGNRLHNSIAQGNTNGIATEGPGNSIEQCTAVGNLDEGIQVLTWGNRIEANVAEQNSLGFRVFEGENLLVKNRSYGNGTQYVIGSFNKVGEISSNPATAGPWANF